MKKIINIILITIIMISMSACADSNGAGINYIKGSELENYVFAHEITAEDYDNYFELIDHDFIETDNSNGLQGAHGIERILKLKDAYQVYNSYSDKDEYECWIKFTHKGTYNYCDQFGNKRTSEYEETDEWVYMDDPDDFNSAGLISAGICYISSCYYDDGSYEINENDCFDVISAKGKVLEVKIPDEYWYDTTEDVCGISTEILGKHFFVKINNTEIYCVYANKNYYARVENVGDQPSNLNENGYKNYKEFMIMLWDVIVNN